MNNSYEPIFLVIQNIHTSKDWFDHQWSNDSYEPTLSSDSKQNQCSPISKRITLMSRFFSVIQHHTQLVFSDSNTYSLQLKYPNKHLFIYLFKKKLRQVWRQWCFFNVFTFSRIILLSENCFVSNSLYSGWKNSDLHWFWTQRQWISFITNECSLSLLC